MELVYLWVEDYKNIHNQGFNFSPKFTCDYDGETLTINDNPEYIENFFGKNINVTAIVGKNGSGKSSILEVLSYLYLQGLIFNKEDKTFFIFEWNSTFYIQCENYKSDKVKVFKNIINNAKVAVNENLTYRTHLSFSGFFNCITDVIKRIERLKTYDTYYNGGNPDEYMMDSKENDIFNIKLQDILDKNNDLFTFLDKNIIFNKYRYELNISELGVYFVEDKYTEIITLGEDLLFDNIDKDKSEKYLYRFIALYAIYKSERQIYNIEDKKYQYKGATATYIEKAQKDFREKNKSIFKIENIKNNNDLNRVLEACKEYINDTLFNRDVILKLVTKLTYTEQNIWVSDSYNISKKFDYEDNYLLKELFKDNILKVDFFNNNINYNYLSLSSGEQNYIKFLTDYTYAIHKLSQNDDNKQKRVFMFDEIELSFHPNWQKEIIRNIIYLYDKTNKLDVKLHLIFLTHSPFLLSDIPKQNIIFLDKDDEGKCKVVDGLKEKKETFGANIHTLLSDSFFMEDGLMGEFAKSKINEIIDFHKKVEEENKKEQSNFTSLKIRYEEYKIKFWQTQSIIGEEYLKQVIKNHLRDIENILLGHNQAKKEEINRLRKEADRLEEMK